MDKGRFDNIEIKKIYPVGNCLFYIIGKTFTNKNAGDIDAIKEFENRLDEDGINCIKINNNGQIFYRPAKSKKEKPEISEEKKNKKSKKLLLNSVVYV